MIIVVLGIFALVVVVVVSDCVIGIIVITLVVVVIVVIGVVADAVVGVVVVIAKGLSLLS